MRLPTADEFRAAVSTGNYQAADRLLGELRSDVEAIWAAAGVEERRLISTQVVELLGWARQTVLAGRAHAQRKLIQLTRHGAYIPSRLENAQLEFEG